MQGKRTFAVGASRIALARGGESLWTCKAVDDDGPAVGSEPRERYRGIRTGRIGGDSPRERGARRLQSSRGHLLLTELQIGVIEGGSDGAVVRGSCQGVPIEIRRASPVAARGAAGSGRKGGSEVVPGRGKSGGGLRAGLGRYLGIDRSQKRPGQIDGSQLRQ